MQAPTFKKSANLHSTDWRIFPVKYVHYFKFSPFWNLCYTVQKKSTISKNCFDFHSLWWSLTRSELRKIKLPEQTGLASQLWQQTTLTYKVTNCISSGETAVQPYEATILCLLSLARKWLLWNLTHCTLELIQYLFKIESMNTLCCFSSFVSGCQLQQTWLICFYFAHIFKDVLESTRGTEGVYIT